MQTFQLTVFLENIYLCNMVRIKEDIRKIHLISFLLTIILFLGLAFFQNTNCNKFTSNNKPVPVEISVFQNNAILSTWIQLHFFQKIWISNKDNFRLLSFIQTQYLDNKKVNQKVALLDKVRKKFPVCSILLIHYHLFPQENSELPVLS